MFPTLTVGRVTLGEGRPKIITSIIETNAESILQSARNLAMHPQVELIEWRADYYEHAFDPKKTLALLKKMQPVLLGKPLLYTFRTAQEGGQKAIEAANYIRLCEAVAASQTAPLIDVEAFSPEASACISRVHALGAKVVGSWHDFSATPSPEELLRRFGTMQQLGADILKIAVMPQSEADVFTLMSAANEMHKKHALRPLTAMSMGAQGCITRLCGESFGACMTFGSVSAASAPGQIAVEQLYQALTIVHENMQPKKS